MNSIYNDIESLRTYGFNGGVPIASLKTNCSMIPDVQGIYLITKELKQKASFLKVGTGGHFKGKNPNVAIQELEIYFEFSDG